MTPHPNRYLDPLPPAGSVYRLTVAQYEAMAKHGILGEDEPVELIHGIIEWKGEDRADPDDLGFSDRDRLTVDEYDRMVRSGILPEVTYLELIEGKIVEKCHMSPPSACAAGLCADALRRIVPKGWYVRQCGPVRIPSRDSEPEPEVSVVRGQCGDYQVQHPGPGDVALVVEVTRYGDCDLDLNRELAETYGAGGIPVYWIVNVAGGRLEVRAHPIAGAYTAVISLGYADTVEVVIAGQVVGTIAVADLLSLGKEEGA